MKIRAGDILIASIAVGVLWVGMRSREPSPVAPDPVQAAEPTLAPPQDDLAPPVLLGSERFDAARAEATDSGRDVLLVFADAKPHLTGRYEQLVVCLLPPDESWDGKQTNGERFNSKQFPTLVYDMDTQQITRYPEK